MGIWLVDDQWSVLQVQLALWCDFPSEHCGPGDYLHLLRLLLTFRLCRSCKGDVFRSLPPLPSPCCPMRGSEHSTLSSVSLGICISGSMA